MLFPPLPRMPPLISFPYPIPVAHTSARTAKSILAAGQLWQEPDLAELLFIVVVGTLTLTGLLFIVVLLRLLIRRTTLADIAGSVLLGASALSVSAGFLENFGRVALTTMIYYTFIWMLRRFGLLTAWVGVMAGAMLTRTPLTFSSWYTGRSLALLLVFIAIDLWALGVILAAARTPGDAEVAGT